MLDRLVRFFTSLRLTVTLLGLGVVLVFFGTLAQEPLGLYEVQARFFRSFFVDSTAFYGGLHKFMDMVSQGFGHPLGPLDPQTMRVRSPIPVFPGGYLIGGLLLINLIAAHTRYYKPEKRKIGIAMIHLGVVLLLIGQLLTDLLSNESMMHLRIGETKNYSEAGRNFELAIIDTTDAESDLVVAIPESFLQKHGEITHKDLPFKVSAKTYYPNSDVSEKPKEGFETVNTTAGFGDGISWRKLPHETEMDKRDMPSGIVEVSTPQGALGTFLVSGYITRPQEFTHNNRTYQMTLRPERFYKPFTINLIEFRHDKYAGTEKPMNFSSRVRLQRPETKEDREVLIYMNNPLRYGGETYYQASFDQDNGGTILQVVRNPGWLTPYFACVLVAAGLIVQFLSHLIKFARKKAAV